MGQKRKRTAKDGLASEQNPKKQQKIHAKAEKRTVKSTIRVVPLDTSLFLDNPKGADLKREVQIYDLLSSEDIEDRLNAANAVLVGLLGGDGVEETTLQRHLERRLFRGLASGRKCARLGFSVVLAEIIGQLFGTKNLAETRYPGLTFDKVLGFLVAKTKPDGDLSGQEEKDHFLGLLFGLESFVGARVLFGADNKWNIILQKFLELANKKPWTREQCGWVIAGALSQMDQSQAEFTLEQIHNAGLALSPEGVGIWITARNRFPDIKFPSKPWGSSGNPLEHLKTLGKALKESSSDDASDKSQQAKQTGNWNAKLHFVWGLVLAQYVAGVQSKVHGVKSDFENFWKVAVDENLFSSTASRERKFWGFLLFQKVLEDANSYGNLLPSVFSHNLVRCLINHVQEKDRFLHRAADKSLKVLISAVEANPKLLVLILPCLIGGHGTYNFDRVTKTKTIEKLLSLLEDSSSIAVINTLVEPALSITGNDVKEAEMRRQMMGDYILNIIRKFNIADESRNVEWIKETALPILARFAYGADVRCKPALCNKTRTIFRTRLMSSFGHLLSDLQGYIFPCDLLRSFTPDAVEMDQGITEAKDSAISTMEKILKRAKKGSAEHRAPLQALALLYSLVVFQLYNGEPEAVSILDELKLCYDKLIRHKDTEDSVDASEVLVELLLSFISKPSSLLRKVTQHVFGAFMSDMTAGGLQLMADVLGSGESLRGQQELFDQEPEDGEDMDVEDDGEEENDSDVEVVDLDGDEGHLNGHLNADEDEESEDEESDDEEDDASEDEGDKDAEKLNLALAQALGTSLPGQEGDDEDSDADMTDSEMMQLDAKLVEIFSARKKAPNKKQEQKDAKETMVNFKGRVLDLLEIYAKKQATNPLAFGLLLPLLQLIRTTKAKQLAEKAYNIILAFAKASKAAKKDEIAEVNASEQLKLLKAIHTEASKDPSHLFARATSSASLLVASSLYRSDKSSVKKIATVYRDSQVAWLDGDVKMQAAFFVDWVNWCQSHANA